MVGKGLILSSVSRETVETKSFSRFIPLLLFLVQKKETIISAKLCVMVRGTSNTLLVCSTALVYKWAMRGHRIYVTIGNPCVSLPRMLVSP